MAEKKPALTANPLAPEIYADRATSVSVRGNVARISVASERAGEDAHDTALVVSGHLAMSVRGFVQLYTQMQSVVLQMQDSGLLKVAKSSEKTPNPAKKAASAPRTGESRGRAAKNKKT